MELLRKEAQHKQEIERLSIQGSLSTEALIATTSAENASILASLKQHEASQSGLQKDAQLQAQMQLNEERSRLSEQINATERAKAEAIAEAYKMAMQSQHSSVNQMIQGLTQVGSAHSGMAGHLNPGGAHPGFAPPPPPPTSTAQIWHVHLQNQQYGPYSVDQLRNMVSERRLSPDTMVWRNGMANWARADQCVELQQLFQQAGVGTPPPFPGSTPPPMN